jgi:S-layer protein
MATSTDLIQQLYVAYYNRPADVAGLNYWVAALDGGATIDQISKSFNTAKEYTDNYAGKAPEVIVDTVYMNLFGRHAESAGLDYWGPKVLSGAITVADLVKQITAGAVDADGNPNADGLAYANKVTAAEAFTTELNTAGNEAERIAYASGSASVLAAAKTYLAGVTTDATLATAVAGVHDTAQAMYNTTIPVVNATLTTGVDNIVGGASNDTFSAVLDLAANKDATLTVLDSIDGGAGNNILNITDLDAAGTGLPVGFTMKNVGTVNLTAAGAAVIDTTAGITGLKALNILASTGADNIVAGSEAVTVVDTAGTVTLDGGSTQNVTTAGGVVLSSATGAITVVDTAQGAVNSSITDGTDVTLTNSAKNANAATGTITIGSATLAPTGNVTIVQNLTGAKAAADVNSGGLITVNGGKVVSVTETAAQAAMTTASTNSTLTQSAVTVNGSTLTTSVTVNQAAAVTAANTVLAVAGVTEVATVVFGALTAGDTLTLGGLTLTAPTGGLTAKQVAAAFASLSNAAGTGAWTSAAVSGANSDTVVFTSTSASTSVGDLTPVLVNTSTTSVAPTVSSVQGVTTVKASGNGGIGNGVVTIVDSKHGTTTGTISNVTLSNYANSTIDSSALTTLNLSGKVGTLGITNTGATTLDLTVSGLSGTNTITDSSNHYSTVKIHTAGTAASTLAGFGDTAATALTVDGSQALTLTTAAGLTTLKTITVTGAAGLTTTGLAATVTDVNASATTGNMNVTLNATQTTYEGGKGNDTVTINAVPTKALSGGTGVDTLVLNVAAATFSNPSGNTNITGFETLGLIGAAVGAYDATGFAHLTEGAITGGAVSYTNIAAGTDLTFTATVGQTTGYALKDATGTADTLTVALKGSGAIAANTLTASGIESITLSATDTASTAVAGGTADSITIVDTALKTMVITGNTTLTLVNTGNVALTSVDASGMTGGLTYTTAGTVAEVVKGGATANILTAGTGTTGDTLIGGAANDVLTANAGLDILTGGAGNDTFVIATPSGNLNSYATITDAANGDVIQLAHLGVETFAAAKITLGGTAVFQDYANAAINAGGNSSVNATISWFQYNGDTYIVESLHNATTTADFKNGTDVVVKLTGIHDLSTATLLENGTPAPVIILH